MYKQTNQPSIREVTPREAEEKFLSINNFPGQRPHKVSKSRLYADWMNDGRMRIAPIDIATGPNGVKYLMNGQHTCYAIVMHGKPFKCIVTHYHCETESDFYKLFATFDVHATRTQGQIIRGARGFLKDEALRTLPLRVLSSCGSALVIIGEKEKPFFGLHSISDKTIKVTAIDEHPDEVAWVASFSEHDHLLKVGVVAAMIATYRKSKSAASEFWRLVGDGVGIKSKDHPCYKLRETLTRNMAANNSRNVHFVAYSTCIAWWNAFATGKNRSSVKVASMSEPPAVEPFTEATRRDPLKEKQENGNLSILSALKSDSSKLQSLTGTHRA